VTPHTPYDVEGWRKRCLNCGHSSDDHRLDDAINGDLTDPETPFRCIVEGCACADFVEPQDAAADQATRRERESRV
jgi:hypothetical protein